jgi:predicted  nucleic acid-binding Zn-ribbon protein
LEELLKPLDNRIKSLQATVKELQGDIKIIVESLTVIKGQVSKAVAETILPLEDWVSLF